jgi:hypothetical protein
MCDDAGALCGATRELARKTESLIDIVLRVQAEAYELGGKKMPPWNWWLRPITCIHCQAENTFAFDATFPRPFF